jgi:hypothetical protein
MQHETIRVAQNPADQQAFAALVHDYIDWVREHWSGAQIDAFFSHQGIEEEIANFASSYTSQTVPPHS